MAVCEHCSREMTAKVSCTVKSYGDFSDGVVRLRIPYGKERTKWDTRGGRPCHDCGCPPGGLQHPGCDVEQCPKCDGQAFPCECANDDDVAYDADEDDEFDELLKSLSFDLNWEPLETLFGSSTAPELSAFMYMCTINPPGGPKLHEYKHVDTRKCIWLDENATPYFVDNASDVLRVTRKRAFEQVYGLYEKHPDLSVSAPGSVPRRKFIKLKVNDPSWKRPDRGKAG